MRFDSFASKASTSRKVSTWRSGITRTWTGAFGLMSLIATKPLPLCTYAPSRAMLQKRQSSCCFGNDSLLGDPGGADAHERADGRVDQPGRVVVAVPAARAVDEHRVFSTELAEPAAEAEVVRERAQARATFLLHLRGDRVVGGGDGAGPWGVRKDVHLRQPGVLDRAQCLVERDVVLG